MLNAILFQYLFFYAIVLGGVLVSYNIFLTKYYNHKRGIIIAIVILIIYNSYWGFLLGRISLVKELNNLNPNTISKIEVYNYKPQDRKDTLILVNPRMIEEFSLSIRNSQFIFIKKPKTTFKEKYVDIVFKNNKVIELLGIYDEPN